MENKKLIINLMIVIVFMITSGCSENKITGNVVVDDVINNDKIKIGGLFSLSGYAVFAGESAKNGFIMAIEDSEVDVDYVIENTNSDMKQTITAARKLIEVDGADVIIGPSWAEFSEVIMPISLEKEVLFISPWVGNDNIDNSNYFFSVFPSEREHIKKIIEHMNLNDYNKIVIVSSQNSWSRSLVDFFIEENNGINVIEIYYLDGDDFRTEISKIKKQIPEAIFSMLPDEDLSGIFSKQMYEAEVLVPHYLPYTYSVSQTYIDNYYEYVKGFYYPAPSSYTRENEFKKKYIERFGNDNYGPSAARAYDATMLVIEAMQNGAEGSFGVANYLNSIDMYEGYSDVITFDNKGWDEPGEIEIRRIE